MRIQINGKDKEIQDNSTILNLLEHLGQHPQKVAVEVNREIIKRDRYSHHHLQQGDEIEILQFVGGGQCLSLTKSLLKKYVCT